MQATTTAIVTVIRTPETSTAHVTPMLSTAAAIPNIDTNILNNNNNDNTDQCNNNNNSVVIIIVIVIIIIVFNFITDSTPATNNTNIDDNVPP
jgi:hypothetical protein